MDEELIVFGITGNIQSNFIVKQSNPEFRLIAYTILS